MGHLVFSCSKSGKEFDSGFRATAADVAEIPPAAVVHLRCKVCLELHEFMFRQARLAEETDG